MPMVLVLGMLSPALHVGALSLPGSMWSDMPTLETLSLRDELATVTLGADQEVATEVSPSPDTIAIYAINPGYTTDVGKNAGELIELVKLSEEDVDLSNLMIVYTAKPSSADAAGKSTILYEFPPGSKMVGKSILLRYHDSPELLADSVEKVADLTYNTSLAMNGSLSLVIKNSDSTEIFAMPNEIVGSICWLGGDGCLPYFSTTIKSRSYTTIVRDMETGEYYHTNNPSLFYDASDSGLYLPPVEPDDSNDNYSSGDSGSAPSDAIITDPSLSTCYGLEFTEIMSYYADEPAEQFIEIYNSTNHAIDFSNCAIRYKNKNYALGGEVITASGSGFSLSPEGYFVFRPDPIFRLTKNPTTENLLEIVDIENGSLVVASITYPHGQKKSASYALIGYNVDGSQDWQTTFHPTPGEPNIPQEFKTCPAGKVINEVTGNCVNATTLSSLLKDCGEGKYRNPETGRCKSYNSSNDESTPCKEGYERNPETNRCRKIKENNSTDYPVVPITGIAEKSSFIALWAIGGIVAIGTVYVIFQFRKEIWYFCRRIIGKVKKQ